jgi:hypothetical protein
MTIMLDSIKNNLNYDIVAQVLQVGNIDYGQFLSRFRSLISTVCEFTVSYLTSEVGILYCVFFSARKIYTFTQ